MLLLMLTVPFQGASAALMAIEGGHAAATHGAAPAASPADGCHEALALAAEPPPHDTHGKPMPHGKHTLKACGAFCLGVAANFHVGLPLAPVLASDYRVVQIAAPRGVIPDGPDKPPRPAS